MSFSSTLSLSHLPHPSEQLCYVHCNICTAVLAVTVPRTILFKTGTVRCGHCTNHWPVNMRGGLLLPSANQFHLAHCLFSPSHNLLLRSSNKESPLRTIDSSRTRFNASGQKILI